MSEPRKKLKVGEEIFNWRLIKEIGYGGMSTVFYAQHKLTAFPGAVKVMYPPADVRADEDAAARFRNEIEIHVRLKMPNLPEFIQAEMAEDGTCILILELIDGLDLQKFLQNLRTLPVADALFVATEVLQPLRVIHATSIHRDIKPANIMVRRQVRRDSQDNLFKGFIALMDFGITKHHDRKGPTQEGMIVGTRFYMSPEQLRGAEVTPASDIYAVGVLLYEMITGEVPFAKRGGSLLELLHATLYEPPAPIADLPWGVWDFIARLLAKDPESRPTAEEACEIGRDLRSRCLETSKIFYEGVVDVRDAAMAWMAERARALPPPPVAPPAPETTDEHDALATTEESAAPVEDPPTDPDPLREVEELVGGGEPEATTHRVVVAEPASAGATEEAKQTSTAAPNEGTSTSTSTSAGQSADGERIVPTRIVQIESGPAAVTPAAAPPAPAVASPPSREDEVRRLAAAFAQPARVPMPSLPPIELPRAQPAPTLARTANGMLAAGTGGTFRLQDMLEGRKATRKPTAQELRTVAWMRDLLKAPRVFRRPGLVVLDAAGRPKELASSEGKHLGSAVEMTRYPFTVGSGKGVTFDAGTAQGGSVAFSSAKQRLVVSPVRGALDLTIGGHRTPAGGELWHGATLAFGGVRLVVHDLVAHDPRGARLERFRRRKTPANFVFSYEKTYLSSVTGDFQMLLVGSSPACDVVLDGIGEIAVVVIKRADGEMEAVTLESAALPYGESLRDIQILQHRDRIELGRGYEMVMSDPPESSEVVSLGASAEEGKQGRGIPRVEAQPAAASAPEETDEREPEQREQKKAGGIGGWLKRLFTSSFMAWSLLVSDAKKVSDSGASSALIEERDGC